MSPYVTSNSPEREEYKHIMFSLMATMLIKYWELDESRYPDMRDAVWDHFILHGIPSIGQRNSTTLAELFAHEDKWIGAFKEE